MGECIDGFEEGKGEDCIYWIVVAWCPWYQDFW